MFDAGTRAQQVEWLTYAELRAHEEAAGVPVMSAAIIEAIEGIPDSPEPIEAPGDPAPDKPKGLPPFSMEAWKRDRKLRKVNRP